MQNVSGKYPSDVSKSSLYILFNFFSVSLEIPPLLIDKALLSPISLRSFRMFWALGYLTVIASESTKYYKY